MMWNQEYFVRVSNAIKTGNRSFTNVVFGPRPLVISTLTNNLLVVILLLFIQNRRGKSTAVEVSKLGLQGVSCPYPASTAARSA